MTEREAYVALNMVPGMGGTVARAAIGVFGSAAAFLRAGAGEMSQVRGVGRMRASAFREAFQTVDPAAEIARARDFALRILVPVDPEWPHLLDTIPSPPLALYVAGNPAVLSLPCVAIVGTRGPTPYGREQARAFAYRLSQAGRCVVSGLARGIDTEAAEGALLGGGRTVAVIGSALDRLYPPENRPLARRIVAAGGAVVSEYPFGRSADRQTFPMRNRIVSGLSAGVLCIEAGPASGTLITADHAIEQGRPVMAIPGRINDPTAQGCHKLIKNGARLVESPEEVLDELDALPLPAPPAQTAGRAAASSAQPAGAARPPDAPRAASGPPEIPLSAEERRILDVLRRDGGIPADVVVARSGVPASAVGPLLIALEMKCLVRRDPTGLYSPARP